MKKNLLLITFIFITSTLFSQYNKFIDENKLWEEWQSIDDLGDELLPSSYYYYIYFEGDTIINNETYNKLHRQRYYYSYFTYDSQYPVSDYSVYIEPIKLLREDILEKKVYVRDTYNNIDELLYDFTYELGDTFHIGYSSILILDSITNIVLNDGNLRKKFWFGDGDYDSEHAYIIEGIGSENGILTPVFSYGLSGYQSQGEIKCYSKDSIELYGTCSTNTGLLNPKSNNGVDISIYPNPTTGTITIKGKCIEQVEIYNISGILIKTTRKKELDLSKHAKGVYFVKLISESGVCTQKLILE